MHSESPTGTRRAFFATAGLATLFPFAVRTSASAAEPSAAEQANLQIVRDFCAAWSTRDLQKALPFMADDCVYRMTETAPAALGHQGVTERLGPSMQTSDRIEFRILDAFVSGPIVMTHRIDRFVSTTRPLTWEGVGVFFVKDSKIKEWSDYTIRSQR
jgi:limonene-1,2-epoxide hydrolase